MCDLFRTTIRDNKNNPITVLEALLLWDSWAVKGHLRLRCPAKVFTAAQVKLSANWGSWTNICFPEADVKKCSFEGHYAVNVRSLGVNILSSLENLVKKGEGAG